MLEQYPPTALELLKIKGLGPKSIALIIEHYRISTVDDLEKLAREEKLRVLPRMGAKLEEKVLRSIAHYRRSAGRYLLSFGTENGKALIEYLTEAVHPEKITMAGSSRRGKETIGDVDILVGGADQDKTLDTFVKHPRVTEVLARGENKASALVGIEGLQVDVRALPPESYGAALQYFTGSKEHNVALRQRALKMGYTLNEYGLNKVDGGELVAGETEEAIYEALGLVWIPPEMRENQGEIEAAEARELPELVTLGDIRGDLHMHTTESDGRATLEEMAAHARDHGYEYIAITDHSKALAMANGLDEKRVVDFAAQVRRWNASGPDIRIFSGLECDILRDGSMDIADDALAELDFVIGSVHGYMNLEAAEMTDRLLRAIDNPNVKAIGHPTGRVLLHREPFPFDFERVAEAAAASGVCLEINASPERLDLHANHIRIAKTRGVRFTISTDAHHPKHLANMRYGVTMARRGWLSADDILNTLPADEFAAALHS